MTPTAPLLTWQEIFEPIRPELERVEQQFRTGLVSSVSPVTAIGEYMQISGGKRIRPALLLLSSKMCGATSVSAVQLGTVVEMIHTATLVHDDVIDEAELRRGRPSTNLRWGNHASVLAGDWLSMQAFKMALQERDFRILDILIELTQRLVEGELIQWGLLGRLHLSEQQYLGLVYRKTACLFETCARLGAVLAGRDSETEQHLAEYGKNLGMAFQLVDDLLDFTANEEVLGKPVGSDLREGKVTLPLIYLLDRCTEEEQSKIAKVVEEQAFQSVPWEDVLEILHRYQTLEQVKKDAKFYAHNAVRHLARFSDSPYARALGLLPDLVVNRDS
ncbi:MAG: polyprenyl synthetase family protein [Acidobacteria bacterium]|nr:polyprenyl synthetase family protein [Acidobacteriota bacterium]